MIITVPIYVEEYHRTADRPSRVEVRPLFFNEPTAEHSRVTSAERELRIRILHTLNEAGRERRHDKIVPWTFCPEHLAEHVLDLTVALRRRTLKLRLLIASFPRFERTVAFSPSFPDVWFDVHRGESLEARTHAVFTRHFMDIEKDDEQAVAEDRLPNWNNAWLSSLTLDADVPIRRPIPKPVSLHKFFALMSGEEFDGGQELHKVGHNLDWLYPDELSRAVLRDAEVNELSHLLADNGDRRPVLLLGRRKVGKTCVLHEHVYRHVHGRKNRFENRDNYWHIAPQRLIAGMSVVGQWEKRLLAILDYVVQKQHILCFDDVLGLLAAGTHSCSDLSVAHVLRPYLERRNFRIIGEITPEAFRVLQERDRGFADLFHIVPIREPTQDETRRIVISVARDLENQYRCEYDLDVIPTVLELQARYQRELAFPGKAADHLAQLAAKYARSSVSRETVLSEFEAKTGLSTRFLDAGAKMERDEIYGDLVEQVIGQPEPIEALADAVSIAKARLNDPHRPLATLLFLGPTGVGKTECAKAMARLLFSDEDRLLRFDMNEYGSPEAATRLVGTFRRPDGLLTGAIQRQPFSILLFDEIEKACPSVFDLLLQVLGEARLTDLLGRTADFSNTIIILTSNLGVREAESSFGFGASAQDEQRRRQVFRTATERFFRPEFINRIDRIVPFSRLSPASMRLIADRVIGEVTKRGGLAQRNTDLVVAEAAIDWLVNVGYDPKMGARSLKRIVEQQVIVPVAEQLAVSSSTAPTVIRVMRTPAGLTAHTHVLTEAKPLRPFESPFDPANPEPALARFERALAAVATAIDALSPDAVVAPNSLTPDYYRYFTARDQLHTVRARFMAFVESLTARNRSLRAAENPKRIRFGKSNTQRERHFGGKPLRWEAIWAARDVHQYLSDLLNQPGPDVDAAQEGWADLLNELALLWLMTRPGIGADRCFFYWNPGDPGYFDLGMIPGYRLESWDLSKHKAMVHYPKHDWWTLTGPNAGTLVGIDAGTHLDIAEWCVVPRTLNVLPLAEDQAVPTAIAAFLDRRHAWTEQVAQGLADLEDDPAPLGDLVRTYTREAVIDHRTNCVVALADVDNDVKRRFFLSQLPLPEEMRE